MNLTPAQKKLLRSVSVGSAHDAGISQTTMNTLRVKGLVAPVKGGGFTVTDAGRRALKEKG